MLLVSLFYDVLDREPELAHEDWPEAWDVTLGLRDESEVPCPSCEQLSAQILCPNCGAHIKTNH